MLTAGWLTVASTSARTAPSEMPARAVPRTLSVTGAMTGSEQCYRIAWRRAASYRADRPDVIRRLHQESRARHPVKYEARTAFNNALRDGKVQRATVCKVCQRSAKVSAHHEDYTGTLVGCMVMQPVPPKRPQGHHQVGKVSSLRSASSHQLERARQWAERVLGELRGMTTDQRVMWSATKPAGEMVFNFRRLQFIREHLPDCWNEFKELGF
jgi:hypothetical protein